MCGVYGDNVCLMYDEYCVNESGKNVDGDSWNVMMCVQVKPFCSMMFYSIIELDFDVILLFDIE